jgi:DNA-binding CsgD family transcriptional regulator
MAMDFRSIVLFTALCRGITGLFLGVLATLVVQAAPPSFLQHIERVSPNQRVRLILYYFDTCQAVIEHPTIAFRTLDAFDAISQKQRDEQLGRYSRFLRDTYAKNSPILSNRQKADLFLHVANEAEANHDDQIAGVCEHFAGQYFFLAEDYGRAFEFLLSANNRFRQIGYARIPEIQRYLYELAFNYYYLNEDEKVITLLTEAARYPPFNPNLHIQTYNTLAMAQMRQSPDAPAAMLARQNYQKAYQLAENYRDSVWMGIAYGNLGGLYANQKQWQAALDAYWVDYQLVMRAGPKLGYPIATAVAIASAFYELGQIDSCRHYLHDAVRMHQINTQKTDYSQSFQDELFWQRYYDIARKYYQTTGDLPESARCADSLLVYQERVNKRYRSKAAALAEQRLLVIQHQAEQETSERQNRQQRLVLSLGAGVAVLMALLLGLLYRSSQHRRQQEAVANAEREKRLALENQLMADDRDRARADLTRFMDGLNQKESLLNTLADDLARLAKPVADQLPPGLMRQAQHSLTSARLLTDDDWQAFRRHFDRVYPDFFWQLHQQLTDLSPAEERLMALAKLRLHSRQMSQMLGISTESIRKSKYRLRKKFGLAGESPLLALLTDSDSTSL